MLSQTVVITGGSSGIGLDLAKNYAAKGANIILMARNQQRLDEAVADCKSLSTHGEQVILGYSVDIADSSQLATVVGQIQAKVSAPDILILSAGIVQSVEFVDQSDDDFAEIININVIGSRAVAKAFLPAMVSQGKGKICFVGSLGGLIATYGYTAYSASKFAVVGMAGALRQELYQHGIGVSVLCPPEVDTPMVTKESEHILPQTRFVKDMGGLLNVEAVTQATIKGIDRNTFIIIPGVMGKISYLQTRLMPRFSDWIMQRLVGLSTRFVK
ncbi:3-phenylpropionate-dihydrodiol/cinnamic acid-dihydrodiol dehydrogenase [Sinobacterium norvegicum]|uniref:3-phenylpropionate-dihydrodiol/cinnamic acid-dihydrodiol dehydrogenase n=1 Tax=Sinobacterium norvegicum TaxID=1641715 RepID=A0ABN8EIN7_9GAMM|nr:SDR family NAD(P)-dependent oxidoreductase [Sinobacterium norvegicum]CAH0991014.1 3-phenylpropionate-dihydrodiol/cinnamic acid-dihydrodiol dehydrogenase [Sinobacterium norvegicum]